MLKTRTEHNITLQVVFSSAILSIYILLSFVPHTRAIRCFECDSFDDFTCTELWDPELDVNWSFLNNCSHVSGAKYCIKMTGIYQVRLDSNRLIDITFYVIYFFARTF